MLWLMGGYPCAMLAGTQEGSETGRSYSWCGQLVQGVPECGKRKGQQGAVLNEVLSVCDASSGLRSGSCGRTARLLGSWEGPLCT